MATEVGDLNVIQDEDTLRRMWQQTEDFSRKKEIRMRMYRLREERLKSYYITRETTDGTTVTDRKSTTSSHAESLNDRGFLTMKTKEIRDSASPTLDLKQICVANHSNANQSQHVGNENNQISISRYAENQALPLMGESFSVLVRDDKKSENFEKSSHYTTSSSSQWETSQKSSNVEYSEKFDKSSSYAPATTTATVIATNAAASDYKTTKSNDATTDNHCITENVSNQSYDQIDTRRETQQNGAQVRTSSRNTSEQYVTEIGAPVRFQTVSSTDHIIEKNSHPIEITTTEEYNDTTRNNISGVTSSKTTEEISRARSTTNSNSTRNLKTTTNEDATNVNKSIMRELHKLDSYLSTEAVSGSVAPSSPSAYTGNDRPTQSPKTDVDYLTTYQQTFTNKISQDVSATHNAFASSLRASPTPSSKRSSSKSSLERSSPEKTPRVSPEKCPTYVTSDLSKKFTTSSHNRISTKYEKKSSDFRRRTSTSECDSDDSSATYKKRDSASVSTTTRHHTSKTETRFRETERSSEGSVEREILNKYSNSNSNSKSPDSSPERSAFRAVSAAQAERFQNDIRRQSFPQTPDRSHQGTQKRKIQSEERSYSERINVRQSPDKVDSEKVRKTDKYRRHGSDSNAKPSAARIKVKTADSKATETGPRTSSPTKPKRVTSPARHSADKTNRPFDDITEYTASFGSPSQRSRTQSPEKKPYDYASISPQRETSASPTKRNPIQITSTKITPSYRAPVPGKTKTERMPSPIKQPQTADERPSVRSTPNATNKSSSAGESHKADAHSPLQKNELRKSATSPPKTGSTKKPKPKKQLADKQSESESSESSSTSSSGESDTEGNQLTIEEITENHQLDTPSGGTLDELIKTDDEIKRVGSETVDEFDFVKEEKTNFNEGKSTTNTANEEFLKQEKLIKEGEIDGSIPPAEVVLGKEAAKLLQKDFIAKEKEYATTKAKTIDKKPKDEISNESPTRKQTEKTKTKADGKKVSENEVTKTRVQTTNSKLPSRKEESPRSFGTTLDENNTKKLKQERERFEKDSRRRQSKSDLIPKNTERQLKNVNDSKSISKSSIIDSRNTISPQKPVGKTIAQEAKNASSRRTEVILTKHKSDKDVYKKKEEVNKKYRRAESDRAVKTDIRTKTWPTDVPRTSVKTARGENVEVDKYATARRSKQITVRSKTEAVEKKSAPAREFLYPNRQEKTPSKTLTKTLTKKASNVDIENDRKTKTGATKTYKTVLAVTVPSTRHLSSINQRNTVTIPVHDASSRPTAKRTPNEFGARVETAKETVAKTRTSISGQIKSTTPITSSRPRKDTPKPRQITINVRSKPSTAKSVVSSKQKDIENEIFKTTSSSSSSSLDLIDVEEDGETETIDVAKIHLKDTVTSPSVVDGQHLNVIVRMPSSSRETTPKLATEDGFCTVTDDSDHPRYADRVTEPEDVESMKKMTVPRFEKITDLDEQDEGEETENVSVADRVTKFLENTKDIKEIPAAKQTTVDQVFQNQAVHKTKEIFESIAKNSKPPPPVINRPSVFEQRRLRESIKEEEENATDSTLVGHDGQHKIVSKKLTLQDYEDYVAERESARNDKSTNEQREPVLSKFDDDDYRSREKIAYAETDSHRSFTKNFVENEREELEKESTIHEQIETNLADVSKQKPTPDTETTSVEKRKSVTKTSNERNNFEERSRKNDQSREMKPKSPTRGTQPESKSTETSVVREKQSFIKSQSKEIQSTRSDGKVETRGPSPLSSETQPSAKSRQSPTRTKPSPKSPDTSPTRKQAFQVDTIDKCDATRVPSPLSSETQPLAKSRQSPTRTKPSPKSPDTSPTRKQAFQVDTINKCDATQGPSPLSSETQPLAKSRQSPTRTKTSPKSPDTSPTRKQAFQVDTVDKCDATRKIVQRYETRKPSDKISLQSIEPIKLTTVEVKPSKRIFDHTSITTVNAYDTQRTQQNVATRTSSSPVTESRDRPRSEKSPSPDKRKFDSSVVGAKKLEKRLSTTAKDYQNRKQFFENRNQREIEKVTRQRSDDHIEKTLKQRETSEQSVYSANRKSPQRKIEQRPASRKSSPEKDTNARDKTLSRKSPEKLSKPTPFGVTLKKTTSVTVTKPQGDICSGGDSDEIKNIEKIFDITLLEIMLEKAVRYDVRSRIRAQIRLLRRQMEIKKKSVTPSPEKSPVREIKRTSTSPSKYNNTSETNQVSADRRDKVKKRLFTDQSTQRKIDDKVQSQQSRATTNNDYTKFENTLKKQRNSQASENDRETTYRKDFGTSEAKSTITRSIISGYGVGPTDENGKPLFGLKALRISNGEKLSSTQADCDKTVSKSRDTKEITDHTGRPLFGLKALQRTPDTEKSTVSRTSPYSKTLANKYRSDSADDQFENYCDAQSRGSNDGNRTVTTTSTSTTTMYSSRTAMKSDGSGNVSVLRDEVKGEIQANSGQEPTGKMTRNQLSYEKPRDSEAVVRTATTTRTLNSKNKENVNRNNAGSNTGEVSARQYIDDDNSKSKFLSSSLIRRISNEHFEKAHRKFSGDEGASEMKRDSFEKSDSKHKLFSKTDSKESFTDNYSYDADKRGEYSEHETSSHDQNDNFYSKSQVARNNSFKEIKSKFQQATVSSSMKQVTKTSDEAESFSFGTKTDSTQRHGASTMAKNQSDLFDRRSESSNDFSLSNFNDRDSFTQSTNRESSSGTRSEFTEEEKEAVSLLNKFVGGSVSLHELEVIPSLNERVVFSKKMASLDKKSENQNKTNQSIQEFDIDQIWDEERLRNLLEACTDYEKRRLIRARLRAIMADRKGCTDSISTTTSDSGADVTQTSQTTNESTEVTETSSLTTSKSESFSSCTKVGLHSKTSSSTSGHFVKANSVTSPFAKFRQLERQNSLPSAGAPIFKFTDPKLTRSASSIKDRLLNWVKAQTEDYKNIQIDNFSTSWNNGLAFCALIHHFCPHAFDYNKLTPEQRRYNFELAFRIAEQEAGIVPLLDVEDMVIMKRPDWKCVFTYVQSVYQRFHASPEANRPNF